MSCNAVLLCHRSLHNTELVQSSTTDYNHYTKGVGLTKTDPRHFGHGSEGYQAIASQKKC